ncbi:MAG: DUF4347 domain-containing protein [Alkalinema sp. RU_4_3]|nr:DUF4347 domain-containing protein [Alkalinema sp. RU_4_3]
MDKTPQFSLTLDAQMGQPLEQLLNLDAPLFGVVQSPMGVDAIADIGTLQPMSNATLMYLGSIEGSVIPESSSIAWAQPEMGLLASNSAVVTPWDAVQPEDVLTNPGLAVPIPKEIVFIDGGVENYQEILKGVNPWAEVVILGSDRDGISQITEVLSHRDDLSAIHIFSHGNEAALNLGDTKLTQKNLANYSSQIQTWKSALNDTADILLYGCDLASGISGQQFINQLSYLTGADVAASDDLTGASILGGDWLLEYTTGSIETTAIQSSYSGVLFDLTIADIYTAWQSGTLDPNNWNPATLKLDDNSFVSGQLTIGVNNSQTLEIKGASLGAFVGTGASTATTADDRGLSFSGVNVQLTLSANGNYDYEFAGQASLTNVADLALSADRFIATGKKDGATVAKTTVELNDFDLALGSVGRLTGNTLAYSVQNGSLEILTDNAAAYFGKGFDTPLTDEDDAGLQISNLNFNLSVPTGAGYSYAITQGTAAISDVAGLSLSAANVVASGDADNVNIALTNFDLGLGDTARLSGTTLNFIAADNAGTKTTKFTTTGATAFVGQGASTSTLSDDIGLEVSNSSLNLLLNEGHTYRYDLNAQSLAMRGLPGAVISAQTVAIAGASGDPTQATLGNFTLQLANDLRLSGDELGFLTDGDKTTLAGNNLSGFVGNGFGSASPIGLGISNASLGMLLKETSGGTGGYAVRLDGRAALLGVPDVKVTGSVAVALNRMGEAIDEVIPLGATTKSLVFTQEEANLTQIKGLLDIDLAGFAALQGSFSIEQTADALLIGATDASAFVGAAGSGVQISNANLGLLVETDRANAFALVGNGDAAIVGIQGLTGGGSVSLAVNRTGLVVNQVIETPGGTVEVKFEDDSEVTEVSGLMDLSVENYAILKGAVKVNKKATKVGNVTETQLLVGVTDATAFVGTGAGTKDASGFELRDGRLGLVIETKTEPGQATQEGFALVGSGLAGLVGIDELSLTGGAKIAINRMGKPVDVTIDTLSGSVAVKFDQAADVTRVTGSGMLNLMGVVQASGDFGIDKTETTTNGVTKSKLLLGMKNSDVFVGGAAGTPSQSGIQIRDGELGLVVFSEKTATTVSESKYAFQASGSAGLVGVQDLTLEGDLAVRINRTGILVDETVEVGLDGDSVRINFGAGQENQTRVKGQLI